jgi:hypothetical protein
MNHEPTTPDRSSSKATNLADTIARLEKLDDVIFPAIDGDEQALGQLEPTWREAVAALDPELVRESRNEYLRYARDTWEFLRRNSAEQSGRILAVLQIIALLSGIDM